MNCLFCWETIDDQIKVCPRCKSVISFSDTLLGDGYITASMTVGGKTFYTSWRPDEELTTAESARILRKSRGRVSHLFADLSKKGVFDQLGVPAPYQKETAPRYKSEMGRWRIRRDSLYAYIVSRRK